MDILDLQFEFNADIEFIGDNETDRYLMQISRPTQDTATSEGGHAKEFYRLSGGALHEIAIGLEAMAKIIRQKIAD